MCLRLLSSLVLPISRMVVDGEVVGRLARESTLVVCQSSSLRFCQAVSGGSVLSDRTLKPRKGMVVAKLGSDKPSLVPGGQVGSKTGLDSADEAVASIISAEVGLLHHGGREGNGVPEDVVECLLHHGIESGGHVFGEVGAVEAPHVDELVLDAELEEQVLNLRAVNRF